MLHDAIDTALLAASALLSLLLCVATVAVWVRSFVATEAAFRATDRLSAPTATSD